MGLIETCKYYSEQEGSLSEGEWKLIMPQVRLSNKVNNFLEELKKLGVSEEVINKANQSTKENY
jgi:hypothetical protein